MPSKYGARRMYVEADSQANRSPAGTGKPFQRSSPANTSAYDFVNIADLMFLRTRSSTSFADGQTSRRNTGLPSAPVPRGSAWGAMAIRPARADATASGGDVR